MILPGHLAAGYLTATAIVKIMKPEIDPAHLNYLIVLGTFFGMIPDLDAFWVFYKNKRFVFKDEAIDHRSFLSHVPLLWMIVCVVLIAVFSITDDEYMKYASVILTISVLSHFILDSIQVGIMWFWPFSKRKYALKDENANNIIHGKHFLGYWIKFVELYATKMSVTFWAEVALTVAGLITFAS
jgi:membrane-bound metal-dependent hydrolase YbcI (DUF457 family)